ncbi:hypothetical protein [Variovorax sp. JS1663]|uniref:hypothetical protein n=1 Tax=Variovorax sp. JS1663 TaxID=1851577 RepID=UPI000B349EF2|nr:hypothetical protein [Variovorax sp. JS1663]OUL98555.1 hypothetical protein A8M77_31025 [Variovorax sp. JS1663]
MKIDLKKLGDEIVQVVREYVGQQLVAVSKQLSELSARIDQLPAPKDGKDGVDGKDADPIQIKALVDEAVALIPAPKDGTSVTVEDVAPMVDNLVKAAVAKIPAPANGKDADPEVIAEMVRAEIAKLPAPVDGKSVTPEDLAPLIASEVAKAVSALPAPKDGLDGKDAPPVDEAVIVQQVLAQIPAPKDGTSVTVDDVAPLIAREVKAAVERIPKPQNGKDAEPLDQQAIVAEVLAQVRIPEDGKSIMPEDVAPMLADLVGKAIAELPRPKDGVDGQSVPVEQVQRMVAEEVTKAVAAIPVPKDGEHGRDALDIEILPTINESRRYARGTYASHKGGIWRAMRSTEGMDGWECIVDGDADDEVELGVDLRTFTLRKIKSSGRVIEKSFKLPVVIHRGIYQADQQYEAGDAATWDGSTWIALQATKDKPGTNSEAWRLSTKRGRDGRDGNRGEKGERGAEGRAGRDLTQFDPLTGAKW